MNIVHVVWSARYGGAETMLVDILNYQAKYHDISLLIINDAVDLSLLKDFDSKIKITRIDRPLGSRNLWYILKLNLFLLFNNYDIIHFHQDDIIRYLPIYKVKKNFCLTVHSVEMDVISLPKYNYLFSISEVVKEKLKKDEGLDSTLIINGIDLKKIKIKDSLLSSDGILKLVQVSRLEHLHKGQDILLQAVRRLIDEYHFTQFHLDLIGDGSSLNYLLQLKKELNLDDYVTFCGVRSKEYVQSNLCKYDLLIQPSNWEGFGLTAIEAMSARVPLLVSNVDGLRVNAQNGKNAFVFEQGNVENCAKMLHYALTCPAQEKNDIIERASQYIHQYFDVTRTAREYLNQYEQILKLK